MSDAPTLSAARTALLLMDSSLLMYGDPWYSLPLLSFFDIPCRAQQTRMDTVSVQAAPWTLKKEAMYNGCSNNCISTALSTSQLQPWHNCAQR
jgi:hypothetical protein